MPEPGKPLGCCSNVSNSIAWANLALQRLRAFLQHNGFPFALATGVDILPMSLNTNWSDWVIFGIYLIGVFGFGIFMSRRERTSTDFFLAGRRLPWYAIALSLFSTNISTGSLIGL